VRISMQGITDAGVDEPVWLELSPDQAATIAADVLENGGVASLRDTR
jgi:hypothetical protein